MSVEINTLGLLTKLFRIKKALPLAVSKILQEVGDKMLNDIVTAEAVRYSPSWQSSLMRGGPNKGQPYFFENHAERGLLDAIASTRAKVQMIDSVVDKGKGVTAKYPNAIVNLSIGDYAKLAAQTKMNKGSESYSDLFLGHGKYERPAGVRAGGSQTHGFDPRFGKMQEGREPFHPGVTPVFMFEDTLQAYKERIRKDVALAIKSAFK